MPTSYILDKHSESFIQAQLASGRYDTANEVMREALRLLEEREQRLGSLDSDIERGMADIQAGSFIDADTVFDRLEAKYARMGEERGLT